MGRDNLVGFTTGIAEIVSVLPLREIEMLLPAESVTEPVSEFKLVTPPVPAGPGGPGGPCGPGSPLSPFSPLGGCQVPLPKRSEVRTYPGLAFVGIWRLPPTISTLP